MNYIGRLKRTRRVGVSEKDIIKFKTPKHFTLFNDAVRVVENRIVKNFSTLEYLRLIEKFSSDINFVKNCDNYLENPDIFTKPAICKINYEGDYNSTNLKSKEQNLSSFYQTEKTLRSEMASINRNMRDSVGSKFLMRYDNPAKIRFLLESIKKSGKRDFKYNSTDKKNFIKKFYNDESFNKFYKLYLSSGNRYVRPSLDHKIPLSKNGTNDLENLHFISFLENNAKNDMTWNDWIIIKKNIDKFMDL